MTRHIPRIYFDNEINNNELILPERCNNHLIKVLRMQVNNELIIYNEKDGEWLCNIIEINKNKILVKCNKLLRQYKSNTKLHLAFCLIKYDNIKLVIEKCTELGITDFHPLISDYTQYSKLNIDKLNIIAIQASEQSERLDVPIIHNIKSLNDFIKNLPNNIHWYSAIERINGNNMEDKIDLDNVFFQEKVYLNDSKSGKILDNNHVNLSKTNSKINNNTEFATDSDNGIDANDNVSGKILDNNISNLFKDNRKLDKNKKIITDSDNGIYLNDSVSGKILDNNTSNLIQSNSKYDNNVEFINNKSDENLSQINSNSVGFIVGPEGGFSEKEKELLINKTTPISLSQNILRAETACICGTVLLSSL